MMFLVCRETKLSRDLCRSVYEIDLVEQVWCLDTQHHYHPAITAWVDCFMHQMVGSSLDGEELQDSFLKFDCNLNLFFIDM